MNKLNFKNGTIEVAFTKKDMFSILEDYLGSSEIESILCDNRWKYLFDPDKADKYYIKKVVRIKSGSSVSIMLMEHWNWEWNHENGICSGKTPLNMNIYSSGFGSWTFRRPDEAVQKCFIEYYNTVRDDDNIENMLTKIKVGEKMHFVGGCGYELSSEVVKSIGFDCYSDLRLEIGTEEREDTFLVEHPEKDGRYETCRCGKYAFESLDAARKYVIDKMTKEKQKLKKKLADVESTLIKAKSYAG
jgi:hypothetical protein